MGRGINVLGFPFAGSADVQNPRRFTATQRVVKFLHTHLRELLGWGQSVGFEITDDIIVAYASEFQPRRAGAVGRTCNECNGFAERNEEADPGRKKTAA